MTEPENIPPIHARRQAAATSGRSYLQGYADALLLQDTQDSLFSTDRSTIENVLPDNAQSFASRYPLVTVATLGAAAGATFVGTSYLTARLLRRGLSHSQGAAESRYAAHVARAAQEDAERRIVAEVQAVRRVCRDEIRDIQPAVHNSLAQGLRSMLEADLAGILERSAAKAVRKELAAVKEQGKEYLTKEDLESTTRELFDQMVMATRDRRVETQGVRSEMMGQMVAIQDLIEGLKADLEDLNVKEKEQKEQVAAAASAPRSEGERATNREVEDLRDSQAAAAAAAYYNHGIVPEWFKRSAPQATPHDKFDQSLQSALDDCSARRDNDPTQYDPSEEPPASHQQPHTYYPSPPPPSMSAEDEVHKETARQDLYDDIKSYKDYYQSVMDASGEMPSRTDAQEMVDQLHDAQEAIAPGHGPKKTRRKIRRSTYDAETDLPADDSATSTAWPSEQSNTEGPNSSSGLAPESDWAWTGLDLFPSSRSANTSSTGSGNHLPAAAAPSSAAPFLDKPPRATNDSAPEPRKSKKAASPVTTNIPRLGVDDSGDWRFILMPRPRAALRAEGWRLADLIYESSDSYHENDHGFEFSSSGSDWEMYSNQQVYFYPVSKVARIDGKLWRCVQCSEIGEYRIVEDLGDVTRPEWDGVGYSKD